MKDREKALQDLFSSSGRGFSKVNVEVPAAGDLAKYGFSGAQLFQNHFFSGYSGKRNEKEVENDISALMEARNADGYIGRSLWNINHKMVANQFELYVKNNQNEKQKINMIKAMSDYFGKMINASGHTKESFFDELAHNIHYSNIFIHKQNNYVKNKTEALTIMPLLKWRPVKRFGFGVLEWEFIPEDRSIFVKSNILFDYKNIVHLTINKEIDKLFGVPLLKTAIVDSSLKRELENAAVGNFINATEQKPYISVGDLDKGAPQEELDGVSNYFAGLKDNQIPVVSKRTEINKTSVDYVDGLGLIDTFTDRVIASTGSSKTGFGSSSSGRQSAEADTESETQTVDSLQQRLCIQLNRKLFLQLNYELFGDIPEDQMVFIRANENWNTKERKEKHNAFMWTTGGIDQAEYEKRTGTKIDVNKTFTAITKEHKNKLAANLTDPANQYGARGTSKPSKKN